MNIEIRNHIDTWRRYSRGIMRDDIKGDDLLSEVLLKILENQKEKATELASEGKLLYYVNRSIYLMAIDSSSRYSTHYRRYSEKWADASVAYLDEPDQPWLGSRIDNEYLDSYIALMPEMESIMLRLYMMDGFSYKEVSKATKIPVKDLYKIVEGALNKLRKNATL